MIDPKEIDKLATLARLEISSQEKETITSQINTILEYVGQIKEVNLSAQREEISHSTDLSDHSNIVRNVMREDMEPHESGIYSEKLLGASPKSGGGYIKVKKIL